MLSAYRRHLETCDYRHKGQNFTLCDCPIWVYGKIDGRPVRQSARTNDWDRAMQRIENLERGGEFLPVNANAPKLEHAKDAFLKSCRSRNLEESTVKSYGRTLGHLVTSLGASRLVASISTETLDAYREGRKVMPRTWRKELETLRAFFAWCQDRDWCKDNPAKRIRMPLVDDVATLPFPAEEVQALMAACERIASDDPGETPYIRKRARALVLALLYSGLRISDVAQLRRAALEPSGHLVLRVMKTGVPLKVLLNPDAIKALNDLPAISREYFFWTGAGDLVTCIKNMRRTVQRLGKLAGVRAHPHRFRDTFAVELLTNGADIFTVQRLLGHESVKTTQKHYAHFIPAHQALLDRAAATLDFRPKPARPLLVKPVKNRRRNA